MFSSSLVKVIFKYCFLLTKIRSTLLLGSGCGSVGRAVASNNRDLRFVSRHRQNFLYQLDSRKDENKEKAVGNGPSLKKCPVVLHLPVKQMTTSPLEWML